MDNRSSESRSALMSSIGGKNTKPELVIRKYLHSKGYRYRLHQTNLPGSPDLVLKKYKTVIFINGCFWHGHNCSQGKIPKTKVEYWENKIAHNKKRDNKNYEKLLELGWNILVIWGCRLRSYKRQTIVLSEILKTLDQILDRTEASFISL